MIYVNGTPVNTTVFPDNTSQVWKVAQLEIPGTNWVHVKWEYSHEGEFMQLAQLKSLLRNMGFKASLRLPYLPYGRQDKEITNSSTFALRIFATMLNYLDFEEVLVCDPHSGVAKDFIIGMKAYYPTEQLQKAIDLTKSDLVCYPDAGATEKYGNLYSYPFIFGEKVRDQATGNITSYKLVGDPNGRKVLIVDDICDGGATFKLLAKDLLAAGATDVNLFVSHGIFSRGLRTLLDSGIKRVFTKDGEASSAQDMIAYRKL